MCIEERDLVIAEIYDERSSIRFKISDLSFDELQDICSFHKTFRICLIIYDPLNDSIKKYNFGEENDD